MASVLAYLKTSRWTLLQDVLGMEAVPAALGVFYVFKDEALRQQFLRKFSGRLLSAGRYQSRVRGSR
jgi:hypothetical protein